VAESLTCQPLRKLAKILLPRNSNQKAFTKHVNKDMLGEEALPQIVLFVFSHTHSRFKHLTWPFPENFAVFLV